MSYHGRHRPSLNVLYCLYLREEVRIDETHQTTPNDRHPRTVMTAARVSRTRSGKLYIGLVVVNPVWEKHSVRQVGWKHAAINNSRASEYTHQVLVLVHSPTHWCVICNPHATIAVHSLIISACLHDGKLDTLSYITLLRLTVFNFNFIVRWTSWHVY